MCDTTSRSCSRAHNLNAPTHRVSDQLACSSSQATLPHRLPLLRKSEPASSQDFSVSPRQSLSVTAAAPPSDGCQAKSPTNSRSAPGIHPPHLPHRRSRTHAQLVRDIAPVLVLPRHLPTQFRRFPRLLTAKHRDDEGGTATLRTSSPHPNPSDPSDAVTPWSETRKRAWPSTKCPRQRWT